MHNNAYIGLAYFTLLALLSTYSYRRFDFGPTSTYGAFARTSLLSPALRLNLKPLTTVQTLFALRGHWRANTADGWVPAGINGQDAYIGTQVEARFRWQPIAKSLQLEAGVAQLFAGDLIDQPGHGYTTYAYTQITVKF